MRMTRRWNVLLAALAVALTATELLTPIPALAFKIVYSGYDIHDGKSFYSAAVGGQVDVGTQYNTPTSCTFLWHTNGPWCGYAAMINGFKYSLFDPASTNTINNESWQVTCRYYGCFNPRMVQRSSDLKWILWFNAPGDWYRFGHNGYYAVGCDGPRGPCGPSGTSGDQFHKPALSQCGAPNKADGDFDIAGDGSGGAWIFCTTDDQKIDEEQLDQWWTNGNGTGQINIVGSGVESPSVFSSGVYDGTRYFLTYSSPNCAYCSQDGTRYAWSHSLNGAWSVGPLISTMSCYGQPRTALYDGNGNLFEWIDNWNGNSSSNQGNATFTFEQMTVSYGSGTVNQMPDCA